MRRLLVAGLLLAVFLVLAVQSGAAGSQPNKVKGTAAPVWTLAMDGPRVAYASAGRVYVWNVVTGTSSVVKGEYSNAAHTINPSEVAIAGTRVAWIKREELGNTEMPQRLYTALVGGSAHRLRRVLGYNNTDCGLGASQIAGLVGSGTFLAVSTWKWDKDGIVATNRRLNRVTPTGLRPIATGPGAIVSASSDGSHVAVVPLRSAVMGPQYCETTGPASASVYSVTGKPLRRIATGPLTEVALGGMRLVVLTPSPKLSLDVYDWTTGALVHSWPVARAESNAAHVQIEGRLVAYSVYVRRTAERLHLLNVTTGKDVVVATANGIRDLHTWAIGPRGLVYVVNRGTSPHSHGKLVFVPMARLLPLVAR